MIWLQVRQPSPPVATPKRVRDTLEGQQKIAAAIASLRDWCLKTETPFIPIRERD